MLDKDTIRPSSDHEPIMSIEQYRALHQRSLDDPEGFWAEQGKKYVTWFEEWEKVLRGGFDLVDVAWYSGAKLNAAYNCLDRHLEKRGDQTAIIWQGDAPNEAKTITYRELYEQVCQFASSV